MQSTGKKRLIFNLGNTFIKPGDFVFNFPKSFSLKNFCFLILFLSGIFLSGIS